MYIDVIILVLLLIVVVFVFRRFSSFVYSIAIIDIFLRIITYIGTHVPVPELHALIEKYFPASIPAIIDNYTNGILSDILMWIYVGFYACFLFYITTYFVNKKK